jgi:hypothetical protein
MGEEQREQGRKSNITIAPVDFSIRRKNRLQIALPFLFVCDFSLSTCCSFFKQPVLAAPLLSNASLGSLASISAFLLLLYAPPPRLSFNLPTSATHEGLQLAGWEGVWE